MRGDARHSYACLLAEGAGLPRGPRVPRRGWGVGLGLSPPPKLTHSQDGCGPPSARLRVPNSSPSSGGRGGVQCLPCPVLRRGAPGVLRLR